MRIAPALVLTSIATAPFTVCHAQTFHDSTTVQESTASDSGSSVETFQLNLSALQGESEEALASDPWRFDFTAWIWLVGMDGDMGKGDLVSDVSASFWDVLEASDSIFALSGRVEIGKGKWGGFIDGMYANIGADDQSGPLGVASVDVTIEMIMIDFGLTYRVGEWEPTGTAAESVHNTTLDVYAGGRYTDLELHLEPDALPPRDGEVEWIDPIVGAKLKLPLSENWHIMAMGDIGGFGVGSDFAWSVTAVLGYDFTLFEKPATMYLGYRAIGQDYTKGSGADQFTWDMVQHGPLLGLCILF